jgi:hypothetical protein
MAEHVPPRMIQGLREPKHYTPPSARELRSRSVHRLQVGLFGLCAMLLIVGLANIIMDRARLADNRDPLDDVVSVDAEPKKAASDPLADIGVVPSADPSPSETASADADPFLEKR